jgi:hypothetical protein
MWCGSLKSSQTPMHVGEAVTPRFTSSVAGRPGVSASLTDLRDMSRIRSLEQSGEGVRCPLGILATNWYDLVIVTQPLY